MKSITQNILSYLAVAILNSSGKPQTGLVIDYEIRKCSDNSLLTSGTATEVGTTGVYMFSYTFTVIAEYTLHWISPTNYEDGFEDLNVIVSAIVPSDFWNMAEASATAGMGLKIKTNLDVPVSSITGTTPAQIWNYLLTNPVVPGSIFEWILTNLDIKVSDITTAITKIDLTNTWKINSNQCKKDNTFGGLVNSIYNKIIEKQESPPNHYKE